MTRHDSERRFVRQKKFRSEAVKGAKNARLESLATCRLEAGVTWRARFLWAATTPRPRHLRHATLGITRGAAFGEFGSVAEGWRWPHAPRSVDERDYAKAENSAAAE